MEGIQADLGCIDVVTASLKAVGDRNNAIGPREGPKLGREQQ
jgi:hypothetical protein